MTVWDCSKYGIEYIKFENKCIKVIPVLPIKIEYKQKSSNCSLIKSGITLELEIPMFTPKPGDVILVDDDQLPYVKQIWEEIYPMVKGTIDFWYVTDAKEDDSGHMYANASDIYRIL